VVYRCAHTGSLSVTHYRSIKPVIRLKDVESIRRGSRDGSGQTTSADVVPTNAQENEILRKCAGRESKTGRPLMDMQAALPRKAQCVRSTAVSDLFTSCALTDFTSPAIHYLPISNKISHESGLGARHTVDVEIPAPVHLLSSSDLGGQNVWVGIPML
jgi:hypothetical protein